MFFGAQQLHCFPQGLPHWIFLRLSRPSTMFAHRATGLAPCDEIAPFCRRRGTPAGWAAFLFHHVIVKLAHRHLAFIATRILILDVLATFDRDRKFADNTGWDEILNC
jgi:hypothetical protein